jgi:coniferyl-aldehyde dehydrogenase
MKRLLERQKKAFLDDGFVSAETRIDRITRAINLLVDNQNNLCEAMSADFGHRSRHQSLMADFYGTLEGLKFTRKHVAKWMKPERRSPMIIFTLMGARAKIEYQPKGVIGNISTWNFPTHVPIAPLGGIFAAGNRAMVKLSEITPETSTLIQQLFAQYYDETECVGITGGADVGAKFAALPLDHIIFTGATGIGRHVLHAAADNLTPVTLELGGKSPVIVGRSADLQKTAIKIAAGKALNSGQVCLSPDYVFVPEESKEAFISFFKQQFVKMFPTQLNNPDYSSVVNARHRQRVISYIKDARDKGGDVREINVGNEDFSKQQTSHKVPLTLVIDPKEEMLVMQEELFGPILCVKTYKQVDECINYVNARPRPLALYYFGEDKEEERRILDRTISGGVAINDVMAHVSCEDLPFGGIGASGMGNYHGYEGFKTFSHQKAIYRQTKLNLMELGGMMPPYGVKCEKQLKNMVKK